MKSADDPLRDRGEQLERAVVGGEPAERQRRQASTRAALNGLIASSSPTRPMHEQGAEEHQRERDVEQPEPARRVADPLGELVHLGPRQLGLEHLPAPDPEPRQDGEREHDDPHPAEPLAQLAPQEQRAVERLDVRHDAWRPWS